MSNTSLYDNLTQAQAHDMCNAVTTNACVIMATGILPEAYKIETINEYFGNIREQLMYAHYTRGQNNCSPIYENTLSKSIIGSYNWGLDKCYKLMESGKKMPQRFSPMTLGLFDNPDRFGIFIMTQHGIAHVNTRGYQPNSSMIIDDLAERPIRFKTADAPSPSDIAHYLADAVALKTNSAGVNGMVISRMAKELAESEDRPLKLNRNVVISAYDTKTIIDFADPREIVKIDHAGHYSDDVVNDRNKLIDERALELLDLVRSTKGDISHDIFHSGGFSYTSLRYLDDVNKVVADTIYQPNGASLDHLTTLGSMNSHLCKRINKALFPFKPITGR